MKVVISSLHMGSHTVQGLEHQVWRNQNVTSFPYRLPILFYVQHYCISCKYMYVVYMFVSDTNTTNNTNTNTIHYITLKMNLEKSALWL